MNYQETVQYFKKEIQIIGLDEAKKLCIDLFWHDQESNPEWEDFFEDVENRIDLLNNITEDLQSPIKEFLRIMAFAYRPGRYISHCWILNDEVFNNILSCKSIDENDKSIIMAVKLENHFSRACYYDAEEIAQSLYTKEDLPLEVVNCLMKYYKNTRRYDACETLYWKYKNEFLDEELSDAIARKNHIKRAYRPVTSEKMDEFSHFMLDYLKTNVNPKKQMKSDKKKTLTQPDISKVYSQIIEIFDSIKNENDQANERAIHQENEGFKEAEYKEEPSVHFSINEKQASIDNGVNYKEKYGLIAHYYDNQIIESEFFSTLLHYRIIEKFNNVEDLIQCNDKIMASLGFDRNDLVCVHKYLRKMCFYEDAKRISELLCIDERKVENVSIPSTSLSNRSINALMSNKIDTLIKLLRVSKKDLASTHGLGKLGFGEIVGYLSSMEVCETDENREKIDILDLIDYNHISQRRKQTLTKRFVDTYKEYKLDFAPDIYNIQEQLTLENEIERARRENVRYKNYLEFISWCCLDIPTLVDEIFNDIYRNREHNDILYLRSQGKSLQEVGEAYLLTRERIRQIENSISSRFCKNERVSQLLLLFSIEHDNKLIVPEEFVDNCITDIVTREELKYLLKKYDQNIVSYDSFYNVFELNGFRIGNFALKIGSDLPQFINKNDISYYRNMAADNNKDLSGVFNVVFEKLYSEAKTVFYRNNLRLKDYIIYILNKYFHDGIFVYDHDQIGEFRRLLRDEFESIAIPENDRALISDICRVSILCGKGKYRLKSDDYYDTKFKEEIWKYIKENENDIILTQSIYDHFSQQMIEYQINDRHHLQGVLRELFDDKLSFHKNYISKSKRNITLYEDIYEFIKNSKYPIKKNEIRAKYAGITDIVISLATAKKDILNYGGEYMHVSNVQLDSKEKEYLSGVIDMFLENERIVNCRVLYDFVAQDNNAILEKLCIYYQSSFFSVLEYLFSDHYQFSRPYISYAGEEIGHPFERIRDMVADYDQFKVSTIRHFISSNRIPVSIIDALNCVNETHLIINDEILASIDDIGIDEVKAKELESIILDEITQCIPIYELQSWEKFPPIKTNWSDWLVYSVINKWSDQLEVALSSNRLMDANPLISKKGELDVEKYRNMPKYKMTYKSNAETYNVIDEAFLDALEEEMYNE